MATKKTHKLRIELEIEGDRDDAHHVVDTLLDNGVLQDAINEHEVADCGSLRVKVAVVRTDGKRAGDGHL